MYRYYAKHRYEEGDKVLSRLHALPIDHENVQFQKKEILETIELEENKEKFNPITLIWDNTELRSGRRIRIGFLILTLQQMMGKANSLPPILSLKQCYGWEISLTPFRNKCSGIL